MKRHIPPGSGSTPILKGLACTLAATLRCGGAGENPAVLPALTTLPGFLDGLGQLLVLLHTDPYGEKNYLGDFPQSSS